MSVNWMETALKVVPAVLPIAIAALAVSRGPGQYRSRLKHDAELVEKLPDSEARNALLSLVLADVEALRNFDRGKRAYPLAGFAFVSAVLLGYATAWLVGREQWWAYAAAACTGVLALACVFGVFESIERVPRDSNRKRITSADVPSPDPGGT